MQGGDCQNNAHDYRENEEIDHGSIFSGFESIVTASIDLLKALSSTDVINTLQLQQGRVLPDGTSKSNNNSLDYGGDSQK